MPVITKYVCDRCDKERLGRHENGGHPPLFHIQVTCEPIDQHKGQYYIPTKWLQAYWCAPCVEQVGVTRPTILRAESDPKSPTLEDLVREIVRQEREEDNAQ